MTNLKLDSAGLAASTIRNYLDRIERSFEGKAMRAAISDDMFTYLFTQGACLLKYNKFAHKVRQKLLELTSEPCFADRAQHYLTKF